MSLVTLETFKAAITIADTVDDGDLQRALDAASDWIENYCGRSFGPLSSGAEAREFVAVYDPRRRWAVATASSRIWNTTDWRTQPPRPPTVVVVVHNGAANPYPGALVSISVRAPGPRSVEPNVCITQRSRRIRIETEWFTARPVAATFRYEQTVLN